jgi:hypothetical protein
MTKAQAAKRITQMENEYGYANSWPESFQQEYEALCKMLWAPEGSLEGLVIRETSEIYTTPEARAAYRAGMSSAFTACDLIAKEIGERTEPHRARSRTAKRCGDAIEKLRALVDVQGR